MAHQGAVWGLVVLVVLATLVFAATILAIVGVPEWRDRDRDDPTRAAAWRADVRGLAGRLEATLSDLEPAADPDRLQRTVLPMAGQFKRLAREAPADADGALVRRVYDLGVACQRLGVERSPRRMLLADEPVESEVASLAERAGRIAEEAAAAGDELGAPGDAAADDSGDPGTR